MLDGHTALGRLEGPARTGLPQVGLSAVGAPRTLPGLGCSGVTGVQSSIVREILPGPGCDAGQRGRPWAAGGPGRSEPCGGTGCGCGRRLLVGT